MTCNNYRAPQLVDSAIVRINARSALYHRGSGNEDSRYLYLKDRAAHDCLFFQCQLVDADMDKVLSVAKAIRWHQRRHGVRVSPYDLNAEQLRRYFAKDYSFNVYRECRLRRLSPV